MVGAAEFEDHRNKIIDLIIAATVLVDCNSAGSVNAAHWEMLETAINAIPIELVQQIFKENE